MKNSHLYSPLREHDGAKEPLGIYLRYAGHDYVEPHICVVQNSQ